MLFSSNSKEAKRELEPVAAAGNENGGFREKVSDFSLDLRQIRPLAVFGQEGELLYAERASRRCRICEFLTNAER